MKVQIKTNRVVNLTEGEEYEVLDLDGTGCVKVERDDHQVYWLSRGQYQPAWDTVPPGTVFTHPNVGREFVVDDRAPRRSAHVPTTNGGYSMRSSNAILLRAPEPSGGTDVAVEIDGALYIASKRDDGSVWLDGERTDADVVDLDYNEYELEAGDLVRGVLGVEFYDGPRAGYRLGAGLGWSVGLPVGEVLKVERIAKDGDLVLERGYASPYCVELVEKADGRKPMREFEVGDWYEYLGDKYEVTWKCDEYAVTKRTSGTVHDVSAQALRTPCEEPSKKQENPATKAGKIVLDVDIDDERVEAAASRAIVLRVDSDLHGRFECEFDKPETLVSTLDLLGFSPKDAEPEFKVGDRVRIVGEDQPKIRGGFAEANRRTRGSVGEVSKVREDGGVVVRTSDVHLLRLPSSLEHEE